MTGWPDEIELLPQFVVAIVPEFTVMPLQVVTLEPLTWTAIEKEGVPVPPVK